ncbi:cobalamin biosynthesis protein [Paenibacillus antibioticophila]|uniref:Cobalamin biosynthesis protein n=1 Tax=Paenibacillus antibioticophila TaxID=1274374 RepID=A0A919XX03_9BACL|nr:CobW family GTP-binding protein [Paenibacillus antibioticophila]GIO39584.1 cobalamin biosynthesis protein [Paenibacillus antibioticophila]
MKTPVIVISGFLGSGKTTLLLELIQEMHRRKLKPAILMNELGKADVDGMILSQTAGDIPLEKLFDGCICCSKKSEISGSIQGLLALAPDVILVELTGVANPEEVVDAMAEPDLLDKVILHNIVTVVDAEHVLEYNSIFSSDKQLVHTLRRQLDVADVIVVNKQDVVSDHHLSKVERLVRKHNEQAAIFYAVQAKIELESVVRGLVPLRLKAKASSPFKVISAPHQPSEPRGRSGSQYGHDHGHGHSHDHEHRSFSRVQTIYIPINSESPFSLKKLEKLLKNQESHVLRAKGYVSLSGASNADASLIQFSGKQLRHERTTYKGPHYLVVIGYDLDEHELLDAWRSIG